MSDAAPVKRVLTAQEQAFHAKCTVDDPFAFEQLFRVEDRDTPARVIPLKFNAGQTQLDLAVKRMLKLNLRRQIDAAKQGQPTYIPNLLERIEKKEPIFPHQVGLDLLIGKSRRGGFSTWTLATGAKRIAFTNNYAALLMAHNEDSAKEIWRIGKRFYEHWPQKWINVRPATKYNREDRFEYQDLESRYAIATAGKGETEQSRGWKFDLYHFSEYAHYQSYADVAQCLGAALQYSWIIKESTANGRSGPFYEEWGRALSIDEAERAYKSKDTTTLAKWSGAYKFFFSWLDDPGLVSPVFDYERKSLEDSLDEYERAMRERFPDRFTLNRVQFRRWKIQHHCQNHPRLSPDQLWFQEYPATEEEMFQATGNTVFDQDRIEQMSIRAPEPICIARLHGKRAPESTQLGDANFRAYKPPEKGHAYVIGADVSKGVEQDFSVAVVLDRCDGTHFEEVAFFRTNRMDEKDYGNVLTMLAEMYNGAFICPEINQGLAVATTIVNDNRYLQIYQPKALDQVKLTADANAFRFGFYTTTQTKDHIVQSTRNVFREGRLIVRSKELLDEMRIFMVDPEKSKYGAPKGEHDDCVIALCLAYFASFHAPSIEAVRERHADPTPEGVDKRQKAIAEALMRRKKAAHRQNKRSDPRNFRPALT